MIACLILGACSGMPSTKASCQLAPPGVNLLQLCPLEMAQPVADAKAGTLLQNHGEASANYFACAEAHRGLVEWAVDAAARCGK